MAEDELLVYESYVCNEQWDKYWIAPIDSSRKPNELKATIHRDSSRTTIRLETTEDLDDNALRSRCRGKKFAKLVILKLYNLNLFILNFPISQRISKKNTWQIYFVEWKALDEMIQRSKMDGDGKKTYGLML